jgi:hypothetical protein
MFIVTNVGLVFQAVLMAESVTGSGHAKGDNQLKKPRRYKADNEHVLRKRLPPRLPRRSNDIYITNKSNYQVSIHSTSTNITFIYKILTSINIEKEFTAMELSYSVISHLI